MNNRKTDVAPRFAPPPTLDAESLDAIQAIATEQVVPAGERIIAMGEQPESVLVVKSGKIDIYDDAGTTVATGGPGDLLGLLSAVGPGWPSLSATATTDATLLALPCEEVWNVARSSHAFAIAVLARTGWGLQESAERTRRILEEGRGFEHFAFVDALTGVHNRSWFEQALSGELRRCELDQEVVSLLLIDVDNFAAVNESCGRLEGDRVLRRITESLRGLLRGTDFVARFGGEEFAVMLPMADADVAAVVAERVRVGVPRSVLSTIFGKPITVSVGMTTSVPGATGPQLIEDVTLALTRAKGSGRDCIAA